MANLPRIEVGPEKIKFKRRSLVSEEPVTEELSWSEVHSFDVVGIENIDEEFRSKRPLSITVKAEQIDSEGIQAKDSTPIAYQWDELKKNTGITYYSDPGTVEFDSEKSNNENFEHFIEFLFINGWIATDDLPESMPNASKNFIINDTKETLDGNGEMEHAKAITIDGEEIFYNPKDPKGQKKEHIRHLIEKYVESSSEKEESTES